jgi:hypothetical protein
MSIVKLLHLKSFCLFLENLVIKIQTILQSSPASILLVWLTQMVLQMASQRELPSRVFEMWIKNRLG